MLSGYTAEQSVELIVSKSEKMIKQNEIVKKKAPEFVTKS